MMDRQTVELLRMILGVGVMGGGGGGEWGMLQQQWYFRCLVPVRVSTSLQQQWVHCMQLTLRGLETEQATIENDGLHRRPLLGWRMIQSVPEPIRNKYESYEIYRAQHDRKLVLFRARTVRRRLIRPT